MPKQFLDVDYKEYTNSPRVEVIPVPYEATTSYGKGTANGPAAIINASAQVEFFDEELNIEPQKIGIITRPALEIKERGEGAIKQISKAVSDSLNAGRWPMVLGGEHSITTGCVMACKEKYPDLGVLQIDAHGDLRNEYEGSPWSHASVMRRIVDMGCPTVGVGLRAICSEERALIQEKRLPRWFAHQVNNANNSEAWIAEAIDALPKHVFITFDVDGLDPSIIRATGTPEPGGMMWHPTMRLLRELFSKRTVVGADVVELAPEKGDHASDFATARLVYKIIGYLAANS